MEVLMVVENRFVRVRCEEENHDGYVVEAEWQRVF